MIATAVTNGLFESLFFSNFRKSKFGHHGLPLTPLNFEFRVCGVNKFDFSSKVSAINYNFCAGCTLLVEN